MTLSAAAVEAHRSWSWLIALGVGYGLFVVLAPLIRKIKNPSPTPAIEGVKRIKVQAKVGVTDDEPTSEPEVGWWGRIVEMGGLRYRQVRQVLATGSHELPEADDETDVDVPLDDAEDGKQDKGGEPIDKYIARARDLKVPYNAIVRVVIKHYGVSESTAKRRIREVDERRRATP